MTRILRCAVACVLLLGGAVSGQEEEKKYQGRTIEEWIRDVADDNAEEYAKLVAQTLIDIGPAAVPLLVGVLEDEEANGGTIELVSHVLGSMGPSAEPAVPALARLLGEEGPDGDFTNQCAAGAIYRIYRGRPPWWVIALAYRAELSVLTIGLAAWFLLAVWFPRHRPDARAPSLALIALVAVPPGLVASGSAYHAMTVDWAKPFMFEAPSWLLLPLPVAVPGLDPRKAYATRPSA